MINDEVIKEIYKRYKKPAKREELNLPYFQTILSENNPIVIDDEKVEITNMEEFSPFKRFLIRSIYSVIEFERMVAFVFHNHIMFLDKQNPVSHIHLRPERKKGLFGIFNH
mgnify:CR=1 FL=1